MAEINNDQLTRDFHDAVNMTAAALEGWLGTPDSQAVGWKGPDGHGEGESVGHQEGERIVAILGTNAAI